ncbi:hypothetical protein [Pedobacter caeni]|uniref:Uncharacterized protein n=1 Tax=Pedobacter caeni TaxID=288992 RepID=A0A1M4VJ63_9SPHI|nr:hypothetical protein [Pedobacter caeni]SHE68920.1 hypothetical protein SAMN04488522_101924 [Pedobacter caeni]
MKENINENRLKEQCIEMAAILGLDVPVPEKVLLTALADPNYAHHLLVVRNETEYLNYLLMHPPAVAEQVAIDIPTPTLLKRAAQSLLKWAGTGFSTVSNETYERRVNACKTCPNLRVPSSDQNALYSISGAMNHKSVCSKCGCVVKVKARRGTDTCPDKHPFKVGENRWEEEYLETENN